MLIYKVTNKLNGKIYIGKTKQTLSKRKSAHYKRVMENSPTNFHNALRLYSKDNFIWEILIECDDSIKLNEYEIHFINEYDTYKNGYNMTEGGDGGITYKKGDELYNRVKDKLGKWKNGNPGATPIAIEKRLKTFQNTQWVSGELHGNFGHKNNVGILVGEKNPMFGKTPTNARKIKINGVYYDSIKKASLELKMAEKTIRNRCLDNKNINYELLCK
jgi:group I intron endonuclease